MNLCSKKSDTNTSDENGSQVEVGGAEKYEAVCMKCYKELTA